MTTMLLELSEHWPSLMPKPYPLTRKRIWWLLSDLLVVLTQHYWFWTNIDCTLGPIALVYTTLGLHDTIHWLVQIDLLRGHCTLLPFPSTLTYIIMYFWLSLHYIEPQFGHEHHWLHYPNNTTLTAHMNTHHTHSRTHHTPHTYIHHTPHTHTPHTHTPHTHTSQHTGTNRSKRYKGSKGIKRDERKYTSKFSCISTGGQWHNGNMCYTPLGPM